MQVHMRIWTCNRAKKEGNVSGKGKITLTIEALNDEKKRKELMKCFPEGSEIQNFIFRAKGSNINTTIPFILFFYQQIELNTDLSRCQKFNKYY